MKSDCLINLLQKDRKAFMSQMTEIHMLYFCEPWKLTKEAVEIMRPLLKAAKGRVTKSKSHQVLELYEKLGGLIENNKLLKDNQKPQEVRHARNH